MVRYCAITGEASEKGGEEVSLMAVIYPYSGSLGQSDSQEMTDRRSPFREAMPASAEAAEAKPGGRPWLRISPAAHL
jgi:hypothetical protein